MTFRVHVAIPMRNGWRARHCAGCDRITMSRPDMPLNPRVHRYFGLGLWSSIPAALIVEGGFWVLAVILYARSTHAKTRVGVYAYWTVVAFLTLAWYNNLAGPPPPNPRAVSLGSLVFFSLVVGWAYWMNRLRPWIGPQWRVGRSRDTITIVPDSWT